MSMFIYILMSQLIKCDMKYLLFYYKDLLQCKVKNLKEKYDTLYLDDSCC